MTFSKILLKYYKCSLQLFNKYTKWELWLRWKNEIQISAHLKNKKSVINSEQNITYITPCTKILNSLLAPKRNNIGQKNVK